MREAMNFVFYGFTFISNWLFIHLFMYEGTLSRLVWIHWVLGTIAVPNSNFIAIAGVRVRR